ARQAGDAAARVDLAPWLADDVEVPWIDGVEVPSLGAHARVRDGFVARALRAAEAATKRLQRRRFATTERASTALFLEPLRLRIFACGEDPPPTRLSDHADSPERASPPRRAAGRPRARPLRRSSRNRCSGRGCR